MTASARPRRSLLFMPGTNERAIAKARGLDADGIILDMEDSIAPDSKEAARASVATALADGGFGYREIMVRVNGVDTSWLRDDLKALLANPPDAILIPKIYGTEDLMRLEAVMDDLGLSSEVAIWAMMETPAAVLNAQAIAAAGGRLQGLVMGTNDLAKDLSATLLPGRASMLTSISICLLAARAAGVAIIDGVFTDLNDEPGFAVECSQGRELGFDGKTIVHPKQIEVANKIFGPSEGEVVQARRVIEVFAAAEADGKAVTTLDGKMIEELHVEEARRLVRMADSIADRDGAGAKQTF